MPDAYNDRSSPNGPVGSNGGQTFPVGNSHPVGSAHGYPPLALQTDGTAPLGAPVTTKEVGPNSTPSSSKRYWPGTVTSYPDGV